MLLSTPASLTFSVVLCTDRTEVNAGGKNKESQ